MRLRGMEQFKTGGSKSEEILQKIAAFCTENGWTARGLYTREYADFDTDWHQIDGADFKENTFGEYVGAPSQDGGTVKFCSIKAFRELTIAPEGWGYSVYVPECFHRAYRESGLTGLGLTAATYHDWVRSFTNGPPCLWLNLPTTGRL